MRELIRTYQLNQSQLVFYIVEFPPQQQTAIQFFASTVYARPMIGTMLPPVSSTADCRWAPKRGRWEGGDEILVVIPHIDGRKGSC